MGASRWLVVALLFAVVLVAIAPRRALSQKRLVWFRALLPSWRFFEAPDVSYVLLARVVSEHEELGFRAVIPQPQRHLWNAVIAPSANLTLACHALVEGLMSELAELGAISMAQAEQLPSYRLVQHAACFFLSDSVPEFRRYQLRVLSEQPDGSVGEELFTSPIYERA